MYPKSKGKTPKSDPKSRAYWRLTRSNIVFLLAGVGLTVLAFQTVIPYARSVRGAEPSVAHFVNETRSAKGPWGEVETVSIMLQRPENYFASDDATPQPIVWHLNPQDVGKFQEMVLRTEMAEEHKRLLSSTNQWEQTAGTMRITPPLEAILSLSNEARERLYGLLARNPLNPNYRYPFMHWGSFDTWFAGYQLAPATLGLMQSLTYRRGGALCFSDLGLLQHKLEPGEFQEASRAISAVSSLLMRVKITPQTDIEALMKYWGTTTRAGKVKPLLESVKRLPDGNDLNVTWFFPPVPRLLVYSYPNPTNAPNQVFPDCVWSSMNFFNETPDDRFYKAAYLEQVLKTDYHTVPRAELFGDVMLVYEKVGNDIDTVHMCVFVANGVVFTKNGYNPRQPWILAKARDVLNYYLAGGTRSVAVFRKNQR